MHFDLPQTLCFTILAFRGARVLRGLSVKKVLPLEFLSDITSTSRLYTRLSTQNALLERHFGASRKPTFVGRCGKGATLGPSGSLLLSAGAVETSLSGLQEAYFCRQALYVCYFYLFQSLLLLTGAVLLLILPLPKLTFVAICVGP